MFGPLSNNATYGETEQPAQWGNTLQAILGMPQDLKKHAAEKVRQPENSNKWIRRRGWLGRIDLAHSALATTLVLRFVGDLMGEGQNRKSFSVCLPAA